MTPLRIVVVGSSNTDLIVGVHRLPSPGETVIGRDVITAPGGKGANQAVAAARLGAQVTFVARLGNDLFSREALKHLRREGLDLRFLVHDPEAPSGVALITVDSHGQNTIAVAPGANFRLTPANVEAATPAFLDAKAVLLQLETPIEAVLAAARIGREAGTMVILNPAPAPQRPLPHDLLPAVDIITPNETEALALTEEDTPEAAARSLLERGVRIVIITLGEAGALLATSPTIIRRIPGFSVNPIDATGAGDAFSGGLSVALLREMDFEDAVRYANAVAALSVTRSGAQSSLPLVSEVDAFIRSQAPAT